MPSNVKKCAQTADGTLVLKNYNIMNESGALVPRAFPSKRQFVSEKLNAFKLFTDGTISMLLRCVCDASRILVARGPRPTGPMDHI